ncbi:MAG: RHS repeat protein, partial [Bdellovibrio sp.]|nr:RHS repeat protein [Bdellovibrio sp.]
MTDPMGGVTSYSYFPSGKLKTLSDAMGRTWSFDYNSFDLISSITNPQGETEHFNYNNEERLTKKVQRDGSEINLSYDLLGRLTLKTTLDNQTNLTYDGDGLLTSISDNDSSVQMSYDNKGRLSVAKQANLPGELRYYFDESGRKSKLVYFDSLQPKVTIDYFYSKAGFVEGIEAEIYGRTLSWERTRDELQRPKLELLPNGIQTNYEFDNLSRLTSLDHILPDTKMLSGFNYSFSETGNITNQTRLVGGYDAPIGTISDDLAYDLLDRLINSGRGESFTYDLLGNRSGPGYVTNNLNQLLEDPKFTYQYNERGNLTHKFNKD